MGMPSGVTRRPVSRYELSGGLAGGVDVTVRGRNTRNRHIHGTKRLMTLQWYHEKAPRGSRHRDDQILETLVPVAVEVLMLFLMVAQESIFGRYRRAAVFLSLKPGA